MDRHTERCGSCKLRRGHARPPIHRSSLDDRVLARKPYPLTWEEQRRLFQQLPGHLQRMALFKVNIECREPEVVQLRWDWEVRVPELDTSVFILPEWLTKNREERICVERPNTMLRLASPAKVPQARAPENATVVSGLLRY